VQWDRETGQSWKSQAFVKFGETICVDRFLDSANPDKRLRSKAIQTDLSRCRDRIHLLTTGQVRMWRSHFTKKKAVDILTSKTTPACSVRLGSQKYP
jgi:hypothetical protein